MHNTNKSDQYTLDCELWMPNERWNTWKCYRKLTKHRRMPILRHVIFWPRKSSPWRKSNKPQWMKAFQHQQYGKPQWIELKCGKLQSELRFLEKYRYWRNWNIAISFGFRMFCGIMWQLHLCSNTCKWILRRIFCVCHAISYFHKSPFKVTCIKS